MKLTKNMTWLKAALLVTATSAISLSSAFSATVANPQPGDLFIAFRASGGTGGSVSYIINIGQDTLYRNAVPGSVTTLSLGNTAADLAFTYGSNWANRSDLNWGVFGTRTSVSSVVYASNERTDVDLQSTPWSALDATQRNDVDSKINSVINGINGYRGSEATANSSIATFQGNFSGAASYNYQVTNFPTDFGTLSQWSSIEGNFADGTAGTVLDLYRLSGNATVPVAALGFFGINDSGNITFTAAAVPEPTAALLGGLGTFLLLGNRRRNS